MRSRDERILSFRDTVRRIAELERATRNRIDGESVGWVAVIEAVDAGDCDDATVARRVRAAIRREYKRIPRLHSCDFDRVPQRESDDARHEYPTRIPEHVAHRLMPYQRRVIERLASGQSVTHIAATLGKSEKYVGSIISHINQVIRK